MVSPPTEHIEPNSLTIIGHYRLNWKFLIGILGSCMQRWWTVNGDNTCDFIQTYLRNMQRLQEMQYSQQSFG